MPWNLPQHAHETYERNPLVAVICQLRFDPILKIGTGVPDFQDRIRQRFQLYEQREAKHVEVELPTGVRVRKTVEHRFARRGEPTVVVLGDQGVALEYRDHQHREVLFRDAAMVFDALASTYQAVLPTRLGLRYVNTIHLETVARNLGRTVEWSDLLSDGFLAIPEDLATLEGTRFASEITSAMPVGAMTLRYGLLHDPTMGPVFRLDIDRYREGSFDVKDVENTVKSFAHDIFKVFRAAAKDSLVEWMGQRDS